MEKCAKDQSDFFLTLFPVMEKCAKDQSDGKCSRTSPLPPTVGIAPARSAIPWPYGSSQFPFFKKGWPEARVVTYTSRRSRSA